MQSYNATLLLKRRISIERGVYSSIRHKLDFVHHVMSKTKYDISYILVGFFIYQQYMNSSIVIATR